MADSAVPELFLAEQSKLYLLRSLSVARSTSIASVMKCRTGIRFI